MYPAAMTARRFPLLLCVACVTIASASAQHQDLPVPADNSSGTIGTVAVDLDGDRAVVNGVRKGPSFSEGVAWVYERGGGEWSVTTGLVASDAREWWLFGWGIDLEGDVLLVGAPGADSTDTNIITDRQGAAYLFERADDVWHERAKLTVDGTREFGRRVQIDGDRLGVLSGRQAGAPSALHVFERSGSAWAEVGRLPASADQVATTFVLDGDLAFVGSSQTVDVYRRGPSGWGVDTTLSVPAFSGLAKSGDRLIACHRYLHRADLIEWDGRRWSHRPLVPKPDPPYGVRGSEFGSGCDIDGDVAAVATAGDWFTWVFAPSEQETWEVAGVLLRGWMEGGTDQTVSVDGDTALVGGTVHTDLRRGNATVVSSEPDRAPAGGLGLRVWPNPTPGRVVVEVVLGQAQRVELSVHDALGRRVQAARVVRLPSGTHEIGVDLSGLPRGLYVVRVTTAAGERSARVVVGG